MNFRLMWVNFRLTQCCDLAWHPATYVSFYNVSADSKVYEIMELNSNKISIKFPRGCGVIGRFTGSCDLYSRLPFDSTHITTSTSESTRNSPFDHRRSSGFRPLALLVIPSRLKLLVCVIEAHLRSSNICVHPTLYRFRHPRAQWGQRST